MPCQVIGTEENYYSIAIDKVMQMVAKARKRKKEQILSYGHSSHMHGDNAHTHCL
jgi:hypothetical protein